MWAGVFVTGCALPSGRDEAVAVGMSAAVNELFGLVLVLVMVMVIGALTLKLPFCV